MPRHSDFPRRDFHPRRDYRRRAGWWRHGAAVSALVAVVVLVLGIAALQSQASKIPPPRPKIPTVKPPPPPTDPPPAPPVSISQAASNAALELAGSGDGSAIHWLPNWGLWGNHNAAPGARVNWGSPYWWQSALDLRAMIRYLEVTHNSNPIYQQLIEKTFQENISRPGTPVPLNFGNKFMDDTGWWGLAWLDAARYELDVRGDQALTAQYLRVAEWLANYMWEQPRPCHRPGIEWAKGTPADTVTNAEFVALAGGLASFLKQPGPFQDTAAASSWASRGAQIVWWLRDVNLGNVATGHVYDRYSTSCKIVGGMTIYTEGEMADALVQLGLATGNRIDFVQARRFIDYVFKPNSNSIYHGVLQQQCEAQARRCLNLTMTVDDSTVYKGLFVEAVADWEAATGSHVYDAFLRRQGDAVIDYAASDGTHLAKCQTPHECQLGLYWARPIPPDATTLGVTPGTQFSGLEALTDALAASSRSIG